MYHHASDRLVRILLPSLSIDLVACFDVFLIGLLSHLTRLHSHASSKLLLLDWDTLAHILDQVILFLTVRHQAMILKVVR